MNAEKKEECRMQNAERDLAPRTREFARRVIRLLNEACELVAIFVTISKRAKGEM